MFPPSTKENGSCRPHGQKKAKNLNKRLDAFKNELLQQSDAGMIEVAVRRVITTDNLEQTQRFQSKMAVRVGGSHFSS